MENNYRILKIANNPEWVKRGDIVLYFCRKKNNKKFLMVGECIKEYNEGFEVRNIKTGEIHHPYTQDTFLINEGMEVFAVKPTFEFIEI